MCSSDLPAADGSGLGCTSDESSTSAASNWAALPKIGYGSVTGTSVATARTAGVAVLVRGLKPDSTPATVRALLRGAVQPLELFAGSPDLQRAFGAGILDAARLVRELDRGAPQVTLSDPRVFPARAQRGDTVLCRARASNHGLAATPAGVATLTVAGDAASHIEVPPPGSR